MATRTFAQKPTLDMVQSRRAVNALVIVEPGRLDAALRQLKRTLGENGTMITMKRAEMAKWIDRVKFKRVLARRRRTKSAWKRMQWEARTADRKDARGPRTEEVRQAS